MKRFGIILAVLILVATTGFAQNKQDYTYLTIDFNKLCKYLQLERYQQIQVKQVTQLFASEMETANAILHSKKKNDLQKRTLHGNLEQMKAILSHEQYRKYLTLLNATVNNQSIINPDSENVYLAFR